MLSRILAICLRSHLFHNERVLIVGLCGQQCQRLFEDLQKCHKQIFIIEVGVYLLYYAKKSVVGGVLLPESKLVFVDEVVFIDEMFHAVVHNSFKDFTDV